VAVCPSGFGLPFRATDRAMRIGLSKIPAGNFVLGAVVLFGVAGYGVASGLAPEVSCMGLRIQRVVGSWAWLAQTLIELIFLSLFFTRTRIGEEKARLLIGLFSFWSLVFDVLTPVVFDERFGTERLPFSLVVWAYVVVSNVTYAIFGTASGPGFPLRIRKTELRTK
jgi:hypothetical protein